MFEVRSRRHREGLRGAGSTPSRPSTARLHHKRWRCSEARLGPHCCRRGACRKGVVIRAQPRGYAGARAARARARGRAAPGARRGARRGAAGVPERPASQEKAEEAKPKEPKLAAKIEKKIRKKGAAKKKLANAVKKANGAVKKKLDLAAAAAKALEDEAAREARRGSEGEAAAERARRPLLGLRRGAGRYACADGPRAPARARQSRKTERRRRGAVAAAAARLRGGLRLAPRGPGARASWPGRWSRGGRRSRQGRAARGSAAGREVKVEKKAEAKRRR